MKLCESITAEFLSLSTYFSSYPMGFNRPEMAEIAKLCENGLNIAFLLHERV